MILWVYDCVFQHLLMDKCAQLAHFEIRFIHLSSVDSVLTCLINRKQHRFHCFYSNGRDSSISDLKTKY